MPVKTQCQPTGAFDLIFPYPRYRHISLRSAACPGVTPGRQEQCRYSGQVELRICCPADQPVQYHSVIPLLPGYTCGF